MQIEEQHITKETMLELEDAMVNYLMGNHQRAGDHMQTLAFDHCFPAAMKPHVLS